MYEGATSCNQRCPSSLLLPHSAAVQPDWRRHLAKPHLPCCLPCILLAQLCSLPPLICTMPWSLGRGLPLSLLVLAAAAATAWLPATGGQVRASGCLHATCRIGCR